jgi:pimeloyl-ACP methyl ester carboxylesterase
MRTAIVLLIPILFLSSLSTAEVSASGHIEVDNGKIFYESSGEGPVLILMHDGLVHREIWDHQFSHFAQNYRVIRYDRRGYGKSSPAEGIYSNIDDLSRLYAVLDVDRACLIGMSSGGALAIDYTLQYPDRVNCLALIGAVVGGFPYTKHFRQRGGHLPSGLETDESTRAYYAKEDPYTIFRKNEAASRRVTELIEKNPISGNRGPSPPRSEEPAYRRLAEIDVPTLIVVGEFDIPDVHAHAGAINAGIVQSKRDVIPRSGHLIPIEQPQLFNDALTELLNYVFREKAPASPD